MPVTPQTRTVRTEDGAWVGRGDRVFDYYNGHWGTIGIIDSDGWFYHTSEDDGKRRLVNGERCCYRIPLGNPYYKTHGASNPQS